MVGGLVVMGLLGAVVGVCLALASKIFYVYVDPRIEAVEEALPGANCGGCGLPGCSANAEAIVKGINPPSSCVAGGPEVAEEIARVMGMEVAAREPDVALPGCRYGLMDADVKYIYDGVQDCRAAMLLDGGAKVCYAGCLGLGTCVEACPFGALSMGEDGLPVVDEQRCTGCGTCERVCPKHIITLSSNTRKIMREYTTDDCTTPCQRACPAGIDICGYIREISEGRYLEAVRVIKQRNPFPSVCGRICVHPCEEACRRSLVDAPVAINDLKRFVTDYERSGGRHVQVDRAPEHGRRVAVIGGGAEGMTAAYFLNRLGYGVTVYEASDRLGGLLRTGLPQNRLPAEVIDWDLEGIIDAGVEVKTSQLPGRDYTIGGLLSEGCDAVFVATGGWDMRMSFRTAGPVPGVDLLVDYVLEARQGKALATGRNVLILGGGHTALEAAGACVAAGSESVCVVFRGSRQEVSDEAVAAAEAAGVRVLFDRAVVRMTGSGAELSHVDIAGPDGRVERLAIDRVLAGAGRFPELIYVAVPEDGEEETGHGWQTVIPYAGLYARQDAGLFRDGEATSDYRAVIEAIGSGRRAAASVHRYLSGEPVEAPANMIRSFTPVLSLDSLEPVPEIPREKMPELSPEEQILHPSKEIALGFSKEQADRESRRCLQCGIICYRRPKNMTLH